MNLKNSLFSVIPKSFDNEVELPTSKSHANRALILGALKGNNFKILNVPHSSDVRNLLNCFKFIGLEFDESNNSIIFKNSFPDCENKSSETIIHLDTGDGGTTNRFLIALLSRGKKEYHLHPTEKLAARPIKDLLDVLKTLDVSIKENVGETWLTIKGPAQSNGQNLEMNCSESTQFATAMLLAFPEINLKLININASETYIELTKHVIIEAKNKNSYTIPIDFSSLSYPIAGALVNGQVIIKNCFELDPYQTDSQFITLMIDHGADISWTKNGLYASSKNSLKAFEVEGRDFPDLIPTLCYLASHIEGTSIFSHLDVLRAKESDRIEQIIYLLNKMGVNYVFDNENSQLSIMGKKTKYRKAELVTARDHRMVMTAYLFLRSNRGGTLANIDCVEKSFPNFFEILN